MPALNTMKSGICLSVLQPQTRIVSQKYLGMVLWATLPPAWRRSLKVSVSLQWLTEGPWGSLSK
jgi:hypothetical protein